MKLSFVLPALAFALTETSSAPSATSPSAVVQHSVQGKQMPVNFCFVCGGGCGGGCMCGMDSGCGNGGNNGGNSNCGTGQCDGNGPIIIGGGGNNAFRIARSPLESLLRQQQELRGMLTGLSSH